MFRPSIRTALRIVAREVHPVDVGELRPLRDEHGGVGSGDGLRDALDLDDAVDAVRSRHGIPHDDVGALGKEPTRQHERRRLARVVGVRLEREAEERDPLAAQRAEELLELADHPALLELVDLDDGVQHLEVVPRACRELLQGETVLREAAAAEADPGAEEALADAAVPADSFGDLDDVGACRLADVRDLVDERDARHQRGVRRELDHLRGGDVRRARSARRFRRAAPRPHRRPSSSKAPTTIRSGSMKSRTAVPSAVNSGFET